MKHVLLFLLNNRAALTEMGNEYCSTEAVQQRVTGTSDECDQEEITNTRKWM